jgi:BlaI family transcriptional regulator, penicillinase repressor
MKKRDDMYLTRAEEQIMQILWDLGEGLVKDVLEKFPDPKPVRNTVSTLIRILESKGFVGHRVYGNIHVYFPIVQKQYYSKKQLISLMENYFNNSFSNMVSLFAKEKDLSISELDKILEDLKNELKGRTEK